MSPEDGLPELAQEAKTHLPGLARDGKSFLTELARKEKTELPVLGLEVNNCVHVFVI